MTKKVIIALFLALLASLLLVTIKDSYPSVFNTSITIVNMVGTIFLRLLKLTIVPIVVFSLINGIVNLNSISTLKSLGSKTIGLFAFTTAIALFISITISNLLDAGKAFNSEALNSVTKTVTNAQSPSLVENVITLFPDNIISPMLSGNMLQIVFIAVIFGIAILGIEKNEREVLSTALNHLERVVIGVITMIMKITPFGVFALLTKSLSTQGFAILGAMIQYALIMALIIFIHFVLVYVPLIKYSGAKVFTFLRKTAPVSAIAFSTASSSATLPVSMKVTEEILGVPKTFTSFVLPLGSTIHMNATAIMQGLAVVFLANIYGVNLTMYDYIGAVALAMIATIGAAGIPGTGLITLTMILVQYNIPIEGIGIIIGIDRLMEMLRTSMNVLGDIIVTLVVTKSEKQLDLSILNYKDKKNI